MHAHVVEHPRGDAIPFPDEPQEQVLGADVVMVEPLRFFLGELQDLPCPFCEFIELCQ